MIELVMVIVLAAILAVAVSSLFTRGVPSVSASAMAKKIRDDIRYTQSLALSRSRLDTPNTANPVFAYRIRFNAADASCNYANQYTIVNDADYNASWGENPNGSGVIESARNPVTGASFFCVQFDSGDFKGFTVSADFGGTIPGVLQFDVYGIPYNSEGVKITAAKTIVVTKGTETASLTLTPNTGWVNLQ